MQQLSLNLPSARGLLWSLLILAACNDDTQRPVTGPPAGQNLRVASSVIARAAASLSVLVTVPTSMRTSPFDVDRYLTIPPNFSIAVYARVPGARFMAVAPNGDLLVSNAGGTVYL